MSSFYDSKHVMIHWDSGSEAVTMQWKRPAQYQVFRDGLEAGLGEVEKANAERLVADHSLLTLQDEDDSYFTKTWIPKAAKAGVRRLAVVVQRRQYVQIPKTRLQQRLKSGGLTLHFFSDMDQARIWVREAAAA